MAQRRPSQLTARPVSLSPRFHLEKACRLLTPHGFGYFHSLSAGFQIPALACYVQVPMTHSQNAQNRGPGTNLWMEPIIVMGTALTTLPSSTLQFAKPIPVNILTFTVTL